MGAGAALVSFATLCSRVLGLVREMLFASVFGSSAFGDAFEAAFRIPNLLRDLFAEGALSAAFVPTFAKELATDGRDAATRLANVVLGTVLLVVGGIMVLGIAGAPWLVDWIVPGFSAEKQALTVPITRVLFPFLPLVSLSAVVMGQLNAQDRFGPPAFAPAMFNVVSITAGTIVWLSDTSGETALLVWAIGTTLGGAAQLLVQVPALLATGFRFRLALDWAHPGLRRIGRLMTPALAGLAATHVNILVSTYFASSEPGALTWLKYGFRLIYLPIGVFGVAVGTIATARLAQQAATRDIDAMRGTLAEGLRLVAFLTVPSTVGLIVLREPIARLLFEHGRFEASDTVAVGGAVLMYAVGLYAYSGVKVVAPAFYSLDRTRAPVVGAFAAMLAHVTICLTLAPTYGFRALAGGVAVGATINFLVLVWLFRRAVGPLGLGAVVGQGVRVLLAAAPCGLVAWWLADTVGATLGTETVPARLIQVGSAIAAGAIAYYLACRILRVRELDELLGFVLKRVRRG